MNKQFTAKLPVETPTPLSSTFPSFLFALYNENIKPNPNTRRNFGLLYPNGSNVYSINLSGEMKESDYERLPIAMNNKPYKG